MRTTPHSIRTPASGRAPPPSHRPLCPLARPLPLLRQALLVRGCRNSAAVGNKADSLVLEVGTGSDQRPRLRFISPASPIGGPALDTHPCKRASPPPLPPAIPPAALPPAPYAPLPVPFPSCAKRSSLAGVPPWQGDKYSGGVRTGGRAGGTPPRRRKGGGRERRGRPGC
jgi:hypothetical protein